MRERERERFTNIRYLERGFGMDRSFMERLNAFNVKWKCVCVGGWGGGLLTAIIQARCTLYKHTHTHTDTALV